MAGESLGSQAGVYAAFRQLTCLNARKQTIHDVSGVNSTAWRCFPAEHEAFCSLAYMFLSNSHNLIFFAHLYRAILKWLEWLIGLGVVPVEEAAPSFDIWIAV